MVLTKMLSLINEAIITCVSLTVNVIIVLSY